MDAISLDSQTRISREESQQLIDKLHLAWQEIEDANLTKREEVISTLPNSRRNSVRDSIRSFFSGKSEDVEKGQMSQTGSRHRRHSVTSLFVHKPDPNEERFEYAVNRFAEFCLLLQRYIRVELRNSDANLLLFAQFIILGLIYGFVFFQLKLTTFGGFQSRVGLLSQIPALFFYIVSSEMSGIWSDCKKVITRERSSATYRCASAYISKFVALLPNRLAAAILMSTIVYYLAGLRTDSFTYYLIYLGFNLLSLLFAITFGAAISTASPTPNISLIIQALFGYAFVIFGGTLVNTLEVTPIVSWLRFVSPFFYSTTALAQNECDGLTIAGLPGEYYVNLYALDQLSIMWCAGALMIMIAFYFGAGLVAFSITTKPRFIVI